MLIALALLCGAALCSNIHVIKSADDFVQFSNEVNNGTTYSGTTVYLESDIDFTGKAMDPVGKEKNPFLGTFDGQGHTISNLAINSTTQYAGIFGLSTGTTIKNIIVDSSCTFTGSYLINLYIGSIIGYCEAKNSSCIISNCVNMGTITKEALQTKSLAIGGIVGRFYTYYNNDFSIKDCANYGSITQSGNATTVFIGGIIGHNSRKMTSILISIYNCINYGTITSKNAKSTFIGGIVGWCQYSNLRNLVSGGKIESSSQKNTIGAIVGKVFSSPTDLSICYWTSDLSNYNVTGDGDPTVDESYLVSIDDTELKKLNDKASHRKWNSWIINYQLNPVTFKINNGKGFTLSSEVIILPSLEEGETAKFSGWFKDSLFTDSFTSSTISSDTTLYSGWNYTVSFDGMGGIPSKQSKNVVYGAEYGDLPVATKDGNFFIWWYSDVDGKREKIIKESKVITYEDFTLYAAWGINTVTFNISENKVAKSEFMYNETIEYPKAKRKGYKLVGWEPNITSTQGYNVTIVAVWEKSKNKNDSGAVIAVTIVILLIIVIAGVVGIAAFLIYSKKSKEVTYKKINTVRSDELVGNL